MSTIGEETERTIFKRHVGEVCAGLGLLGCASYHLTNEEILFDKMMRETRPVCRTTNAVNQNYTVMRDRLLPGLLKILSENKHHDYPQKLFEIGETIQRAGNNIKEEDWIAMASCHANSDYSEARSLCEALFREIGEECEFCPTRQSSFIPGRVAEIVYKGKPIGVVGEIHPQVLNNFEIELPIAAFEINLESLKRKQKD